MLAWGVGDTHLDGHEGAQLVDVGNGLALLHLVALRTWPRHVIQPSAPLGDTATRLYATTESWTQSRLLGK